MISTDTSSAIQMEQTYSSPSETIFSLVRPPHRPRAKHIAAISSPASATLIQNFPETAASSLMDFIKTVLSRDENVRSVYVSMEAVEIRVTAILDDISPRRREAVYCAEGTIMDAFPNREFHFTTTSVSANQPNSDLGSLLFQR